MVVGLYFSLRGIFIVEGCEWVCVESDSEGDRDRKQREVDRITN